MKISTLLLLAARLCLTSPAIIHETGPAAIRVPEGGDAILPCSLGTGENIEGTVFDWKKDDQKKKDGLEVFFYDAGNHYNNGRHGQDEQFKGRVFHFPEELKRGNASIIIKNTKISDSGNYTCDFPRLQTNEQNIHVELVVEAVDRDRSGEIRGAAAKPCAKNLDVTEDGALLQCEVLDAFPKPEVEWQDSAGNILPAEEPQVTERGDRYDIILLITVTKTDNFSCVVRQKEINHEISDKTYASVPEKQRDDWVRWFGGWILGVLTIVAVLALLVFTNRITISRKKGSPQQRNCSCNGYSQVPPQLHQNGVGEKDGFA